ncbi:MAG: hypothetical protein M5U26_13455 [Planctomycetota bacterium]|nr:hypothetical protein [Planctomycetota bacterium]
MTEPNGQAAFFDHDYHTHTIYSRHAHPDMTVVRSLQAAAAARLKSYVVLEHVPEISGRRNTINLWRHGKNEREQLDLIARDLEEAAPLFP